MSVIQFIKIFVFFYDSDCFSFHLIFLYPIDNIKAFYFFQLEFWKHMQLVDFILYLY